MHTPRSLASRLLFPLVAATLTACGESPIPCTDATACEHFSLSAATPTAEAKVDSAGSGTSSATGTAVAPAASAGTIPVFRNMPLLQGSTAVTTAVVIVHALGRNAHANYETLLDAAQSAGQSGTTLVVAPQFLLPAGDRCGGSVDEPGPTDLVWSCDGWKDGAQAIGGPGALIDSYAVMDQLLAVITNPALYPNLQRVVITGHAAGGQFTLRYAATTQSAAAAQAQFLVFNPGSYLYLDEARPGTEVSCGTDGGCDGSFTLPYANAPECPSYDSFPYGLEEPFGAAALQTADGMKSTLLSRHLEILVGAEDTLAHSAGTDLDTGCEANAQGLDRLSRALNYDSYLLSEEGTAVPLFIVPGCADDRDCLYQSTAALTQVFGS